MADATSVTANGTVGTISMRTTLVRTVGSYVALTKPRIIELLLVTTVPTMMLAARGWPPLELVLVTLVGGTLAAASANTLNCYLDRDIDAVMARTRNRPIHRDVVAPLHALAFGCALGVSAAVLFWFAVNPLSSVLAITAIAFYVGVYTAILKRRTSSNIVWGGAAGCMPVLIGWSAVTDGLAWPPVVLFVVIFLWTPPHFWALAIKYRADYARAGVPMLPVVASDVVVTRRILGYTVAMIVASLLLWPVASTTPLYPLAAVVLGAFFLREAARVAARARAGAEPAPMKLFGWSITYLTGLFVAVAVDAILQHWPH